MTVAPALKRVASSNPATLVAASFVLLLCILAIGGSWIAPFGEGEQDLRRALEGPSWDHLLGTDSLGRDTLSRLIFGTRVALLASLQALAIAGAIGIPVGVVAGYSGRWVDRVLMRITDAVMSLPGLVIAFAVIGVLGPGLSNAMIAVGIVFAARYARLTRAVVTDITTRPFIEAATLTGQRSWRTGVVHVLPNAAAPLIVLSAVSIGTILLIEAALSFLGLGLPIGEASWGGMLNEARQFTRLQPFLPWPPGIAITLTVLAWMVLGESLRQRLDTRSATPPRRSSAAATATRALRPTAADEVQPDTVDSALTVRDLTVAFADPHGDLVRVVDGVSFDVRPGTILGLVGESGSGKTLTALSVLGLTPPQAVVGAEQLRLATTDLLTLDRKQRRRQLGTRIGYVPQQPLAGLTPSRTIGSQLAEPLRLFHGMARSESTDLVADLLDQVGLRDPRGVMQMYPHQLSGGMAQRVLIASAIAGKPELLVADECTTALDVTLQGQIVDLLLDLQERNGMGLVFITHDLGVAADICDDIAVMYAGQIVETGTTAEVLLDPVHPYTRALLAASPDVERPSSGLDVPEGRVPDPHSWTSTCRFLARCPSAEASCTEVEAALGRTPQGRVTRCVLSQRGMAAERATVGRRA